MCGKRLNAWKTIPIPRRTLFTSTPGAVISSPWTTMRPSSIGSSRFTQRRSVDLPEPEAPIRQTTWCSSTARSIPFSTSALPNDLWRFSIVRASLMRVRLRPAAAPVARDEPVGEPGQRDRDRDEQHGRGQARREVEGRRLVDLRLLERLDRAEHADERGVLLEADEVVQERRDHAPDGLRHDHVAQRLPVREPERARGRRPGSGAPTRSRPGRPPRRRPCRRARARRSPRTSSRSGRRTAAAPARRSRAV